MTLIVTGPESESQVPAPTTTTAPLAQTPTPVPAPEPEHRIIIPAKATSDQYLAMMNQKHAVTREGGKVVVVEFVGEHQIEYSTPREIEQFYRNVQILMGDGGNKPLGRWWLDHERRRQYEAIVFEPGQPATDTSGHIYNRWRGLAVKPKPGNWSLYYDNLLNNMCRGNQAHCDYVLDWMAHGVQHPEEKPGVAIVFRSDERGTGKSTVCQYYARLFGIHGLEVSSANHLTGRFNGHLETAIVLVVNEAVWAGDQSAESILKSLITEANATTESKWMNAKQSRSFVRVMMTANSSWVVPAGWSERRFLVLEATDRMLSKDKYWVDLVRQMKNGGLSGFLHDLLARDISQFNPRNVPVTEALIDQKIQSMDDSTRWIFNCLSRGRWSADHNNWQQEMGRNELYALYLSEAPKITGRKIRAVQTELGKMIGRIFPGANDGPRIRLAGSRVRKYVFDGLEACRAQFATFLQAPEGTDLFFGMEPDNIIELLPNPVPESGGTLMKVDFQTRQKLNTDTQEPETD